MRIITGTQRGKRLVTLDGNDVRPTPERVKEGIFSSIQFDIEGRRVLDLFAGSGQMGLEALSRGAASAVFVDASEESLKIVRKNIDACGFAEQSKTVKSNFDSFCASCRETFDYAFLDPPYGAGLFMQAVKAVIPLMSDYGAVFCEHPIDAKLEKEVGDFYEARVYRYGKICVSVFRKGTVE